MNKPWAWSRGGGDEGGIQGIRRDSEAVIVSTQKTFRYGTGFFRFPLGLAWVSPPSTILGGHHIIMSFLKVRYIFS